MSIMMLVVDDQWLKYLTYTVHCMSGITIW